MRNRVLFGPDGVRAGWLLLLFLLISQLLEGAAQAAAVYGLGLKAQPWRPSLFLIIEAISVVALLVTMLLFARFEGRTLADYAFPLREAFGRGFSAGMAWGAVMVALLAAAIAAFGGLTVRGAHLHGSELVFYATGWAAAMICLGLAEELLFRGYPLITLARGVGFWPAAVISSLGFGAVHYFMKPGETVADAASVALIGLFLCLTVRRTGDIWFAVGFHAAFDYVALCVLGAPNSGNRGMPIASRLLETTYAGAPWLTGGSLGIEASWLIFPLLALLFVAFALAYRGRGEAETKSAS